MLLIVDVIRLQLNQHVGQVISKMNDKENNEKWINGSYSENGMQLQKKVVVVVVVVVVVFIDTERSVLAHESFKTYNTHTHVKTSNWTINFDDKNTQHH